MNGVLNQFDRDVVPLTVDGISNVKTYHSALLALYSQAVIDAQSNSVPDRVPGTTPPKISSCECYLPRSVHATLVQLCSSHCRRLNSYKTHITAGVTDVCPEC